MCVVTMEKEEEEHFIIRGAKFFRFDSMAVQWKERGKGEVKLMYNKTNRTTRLLMRSDKGKICGHHYLTREMKLVPGAGSDRAWIWAVQADFADGEAKAEMLGIRFENVEDAQKFKDIFEKCQTAEEDILVQEMTVESTQDSATRQQEVNGKLVWNNGYSMEEVRWYKPKFAKTSYYLANTSSSVMSKSFQFGRKVDANERFIFRGNGIPVLTPLRENEIPSAPPLSEISSPLRENEIPSAPPLSEISFDEIPLSSSVPSFPPPSYDSVIQQDQQNTLGTRIKRRV